MSTSRTVRIGQSLQLPHGTFTLVLWSGNVFTLRNESTGEYSLFDHAELSRLAPPLLMESVAGSALTQPQRVSGIDPQLIPHLQELIDGTPAVGDKPREKYAITHALYGRLLTKLSELHDLGIEVDLPSLKRKLQRFRELGRTAPLAEALDQLTEHDRLLIPHLQELLDGTPAVGTEPRKTYSTENTMQNRLYAKLRELRDLGIEMEIASLKRKLRRFREGGPAGIADLRKTRTEEPLSRIPESVKNALIDILAESKNSSTRTATAIQDLLEKRLESMYPDSEDRPATPSITSVKRYVSLLDKGQKALGSARQRQTKTEVPSKGFSSRLACAPGDEVQIDTTVFDAFVIMPDGSEARPFLTVLIDKRTRSILGFNFTARTPTGFDHAVLLARVLVPRKLRPWAVLYNEMSLPEMPWASHLDSEQKKRLDANRPYIIPRRIITDNGKDYTSFAFKSACARYGIHHTEAPYFDPTAKAQVERMFGSIRTLFAQHLPGYTGGRLEFRGDGVESEAFLDLRTVEELFDRWVSIVWQNRQHEGLRDPHRPELRHTPNTMYAASIDVAGHFVLSYEPDDFVSLMPKVRRTVQSDGVEFRRRQYDSPHLAPLRDQKDARGKSVPVDVFYDPADIYWVWVRSPLDDDWIACEWTEAAGMARPHEASMLAKARQFTNQHEDLSNRAALRVLREMRGGLEAEEAAAARMEKSAAGRATEPNPYVHTFEVENDEDPMSFTHFSRI